MMLRWWQVKGREVVQTLRAEGKDRALIAASPATGKTHFAASIMVDDFAANVIDCAVIVGPSRAIKAQWRDALNAVGLKSIDDIDNGTLEERHARGMDLFDPARPIHIVTYQQVCSFPELWAALCARHRVFAVFDEIHHVDDQAEFGQALLTGFSDACFKLSLSGTPCPTKGNRLAFCESERTVTADGQHVMVTKPDYTYSYGEALRAGGTKDDPYVVRPVTFIRWNGHARWRLQSLTNPEQFSERLFDGTRKTDPLSPLLDPDLPSLKKMIRAALDELEGVRKYQQNAGMLITVRDADHGDAVADLVRACGVTDVVLVRYDIPGAHEMIKDFRRGRQRVLIAIKMVAEGVDITRLRVGVYASNVLTWMYFMQFTGRFIRWDKALSAGQFACVFIPEHVTLIDYAKRIESMVLEAAISEPGDPGCFPPPASSTVVSKEGDGTLNGAIQHGLLFDLEQTVAMQDWIRRAKVEGLVDLPTATKLWQARSGEGWTSESGPAQDEPDESKRNDRLVGQVVLHAKRKGRTDLPYEVVNSLANRHVGIPKKDKLTPIEVLVRRREFLRQLLASVLHGKDDVASA